MTTKKTTSTAQDSVREKNKPEGEKVSAEEVEVAKRNEEFRSRIEASKSYRKKQIPLWTTSIDYRRGKPFSTASDEDQVAVPLDWAYTKAKHAALFSQVPEVRIDHTPDTLPDKAPWVSTYQRRLNDRGKEAGIEAAMEECLPDCINAAGFGVVFVSYESLTEDSQVPKHDSALLSDVQKEEIKTKNTLNGEPIEMESVPVIMDRRYVIKRVSPADFLWPKNFNHSNFNLAPWLGGSGRITWAEAQSQFKLKDTDKAVVLGDDRTVTDQLTNDAEKDKMDADEMVTFDEIFYRKFMYDSKCKSFAAIQRLVFVNGITKPVIDEPWTGQRIDEQGNLVGSSKYPHQVLTLTYLTDEAIPPSDSAIGRPQVNEVNLGRTHRILQLKRNLPVRWVDINRADPTILQSLMRGTIQSFIPVQGDGTRIIGEVAKASIPQENFISDQVAKADLQTVWTIGPTGVHPLNRDKESGDPNQNVSTSNTQIGKERARVSSFFCNIMEVLGGLMCLYEDPQSLGEGFDPGVSKLLQFSILSDSTVLLEASQKLERLNQFLDVYGKSGWINIEPVLQEIATICGLDPAAVVKKPEPKPPEQPNISLRLTGVEDMLNPLTLAFLIKSGQAPPPELIEQAKQLIQQSVTPPFNPTPSAPGSAGQELFMAGAGGAPPNPSGPPVPGPVAGPPPGSPMPQPPPVQTGEAHPQWTTMPKLDKRTEGGNG